jgi:hypothetical protein
MCGHFNMPGTIDCSTGFSPKSKHCGRRHHEGHGSFGWL